MDDITVKNDLYLFLIGQGVPEESLPKLVEVSKAQLIPIIDGYKKEDKTKKFYLCVCNSGHDICCNFWEWAYSGWCIRVKGKSVLFFKGEWEFNISHIPISQDTLFVVSRRTKTNEDTKFRADILYVSNNKKKLLRKLKKSEKNQKTGKNY